jgi:hypothetical protein
MTVAQPVRRPSDAEITADLFRRLRARYGGDAYALLPQVANSAGWASNYADAIVMGLWPSRGLTLMGFEIKASRQDWRRELENPGKAEAIADYCDQWWVVAPPAVIVPPSERQQPPQAVLPLTIGTKEKPLSLEDLTATMFPEKWGLLVPKGTDGLRVVKAAEKLEARPMDRAFLAALLRRAAEHVVPKSEIEAALRAEYDRGVKAGEERRRRETEAAQHAGERLRQDVAAFEETSGVKIASYAGRSIGEAVGRVMEMQRRGASLHSQVQATRDHMAAVVASIDALLASDELEAL